MASRHLRIRTLHRALAIAGSERQRARARCLPEAELRRWLAGADSPPHGVFLAAIDLIDSRFGFVERRRAARAERAAYLPPSLSS